MYGTIGLDTPTSAYILDGNPATVYAGRQTTTVLFQQLFYQSPPLVYGTHTLLIQNSGTGVFWLDFILYTPSEPPQSVSSSFPSTTSTTPALSPTLSPSSTLSSSPTLSPSPTVTGSKSSVVAIAGGAAGASVVIICLVFGMLYYRRRARRHNGTDLLGKDGIFDGKTMACLPSRANLITVAGTLELDGTDPDAVITPFPNAQAPDPRTLSVYGNLNGVAHPPGTMYPPPDPGYRDQSQPSLPTYQLSQTHSLGSGHAGATSVDTEAGYGGSQQGTTPHYEYTSSYGRTNCAPDSNSQHVGVRQHPSTSSDEHGISHYRDHSRSARSRTSLAYTSTDRVAMDPHLPPPDTLSSPQTQGTSQRVGKSVYVPRHNNNTPEVRQHEDGGVRLVPQPPEDSSSEEQEAEQETIDLPPAYRPNY